MKTLATSVTKVITAIMCLVMAAGLAPIQVQAWNPDFLLYVQVVALREDQDVIPGIEFALLHNGNVIGTNHTSVGGTAVFIPPVRIRLADASNFAVKITNLTDSRGNQWTSQEAIIPLDAPSAEHLGGADFRIFWHLTPATTQTPEPPAQPPEGHVLRFQIGSTRYFNGAEYAYLDVAPANIDGRTMLPVRVIAEALGAEVTFDQGIITFNLNGQSLTMTVGEEVFDASGVSMGTPTIRNDRTLAPLRYVGSLLGAEIGWNPNTSTASVYVN